MSSLLPSLSLSLSLSAFCPLLWWALPNFWTSLASQLLPHLLGCVHGCGEHTGRFKFMSAVSAIKGWYPHGDGCRTQWCTGCCSGYVDKPWLSDQGNETLSTAVCETMREVWNGHYPFLPQLYWIFRVLHAVWTRQSNQTCNTSAPIFLIPWSGDSFMLQNSFLLQFSLDGLACLFCSAEMQNHSSWTYSWRKIVRRVAMVVEIWNTKVIVFVRTGAAAREEGGWEWNWEEGSKERGG